MRILVGWDDASQGETIGLILNIDDTEAVVAICPEQLLELAKSDQQWDVILLAIGAPDVNNSLELFRQLRKLLPEIPVVGACDPSDVIRMARFLTQGMKAYVLRDSSNDFIFLLHATLSNTVEAVHAEREREIAEKLREEIDSVRKLQESIIPADVVSPEGYRIVARYEPSQIRVFGGQPVVMAGGDYYEVFRIDDDHTIVLVGDASGHGMKACMSIMTMHTLISMIRSEGYEDVAGFVAKVNRRLCEQSFIQNGGGFITVLYGVLNTRTHQFTWTSAGHPIPLLMSRSDGTVTPLGPHEAGGLPLGLYEEAEYETNVVDLPSESRLLIYTDGVIEAFGDVNGQHAEFGVDGVMRTLCQHRCANVDASLQALFDDSQAITNGAGRHDDTSVVLIDRL
ncbi:MAG TPA: SpoIIE family protein phosphatase [Planctomycetaceae bacterium]|nr:SpoIIE family protein phosphatase [Planctomycetaceae bacterium]